MPLPRCFRALLLAAAAMPALAEAPREFGGVYPHLAMFNKEGECGTGAVVPWAGKLWVITYAPHKPKGSTDKLYEISEDLQQTVRPESIGGTPANRMIHRESGQLFIGPYAIDEKGIVRTIPVSAMFGRLTGNARDLMDPAGHILYATMEEALYRVNTKTLAVEELWQDEQLQGGRKADLPGYHGKGLYSGQGVVIYANNGDHAKEALKDPTVPSGVLAEWDGHAGRWTVVRRNQFTEVTGPGGMEGSAHPETDPIWAVGWDYRSLILNMRAGGQWHTFRLPKGSNSYDGAHGWNTEWPRIREIGTGDDFLMTMHGTFWHFPKGFAPGHTAGIAPRSNYLKVVGDFCRWGDRLVLGCDDSALSEFLNKRPLKPEPAGPGQSQSNLWFIKPEQLDHLGPLLGSGAVWLRDAVKAGVPSDPFLFSGYPLRGLHLSTGQAEPAKVRLEVDSGDGQWHPLRTVEVSGYTWVEFPETEQGAWVRLVAESDLPKASAVFHYRAPDERGGSPAGIFSGLARVEDKGTSHGAVLARGEDKRTLLYQPAGGALLELTKETKLAAAQAATPKEQKELGLPGKLFEEDAASIIIVDGAKKRWRLPKTEIALPEEPRRVCREVCTERDMLHAGGIFYELPAENAGGTAKLRPIARHPFNITDFGTHRGLLVLTGVKNTTAGTPEGEARIVRSADGQGVWCGTVEDLWQLGKPTGQGGPWSDTLVEAGAVSDPYLLRGFDQRKVTLSHDSTKSVEITLEVDPTGEGDWMPYETVTVAAGEKKSHDFPAAFGAYWLRARCAQACRATVWLEYR